MMCVHTHTHAHTPAHTHRQEMVINQAERKFDRGASIRLLDNVRYIVKLPISAHIMTTDSRVVEICCLLELFVVNYFDFPFE